jgi:uncharacterized protein (TIGR03435 family)
MESLALRLPLDAMRSPLAILILLIATGAPGGAQAPDTFEVFSLKPSRPGTRFKSTLDAAQFICSANSLMSLIRSAYPDITLESWRVSGGPAWINSDTWDLAAKLPPNMPTDEQPLYRRTESMLRTLLAEEFKLRTHRETREYPVYALVVAKNGVKLRTSEVSQFNVEIGRGRMVFRHESISGLVNFLYYPHASAQQAADRPVIDRTGLEGFFDFTLEWTPDSAQADLTAPGPSIFTAIEQQLGLKLQPEKAPIEFLVIDHAEKPAGPDRPPA